MRLLVDTHVFIWWESEPARLSPAASQAMRDGANDVFLSLASIWEMQIKIDLGKMTLSGNLPAIIARQQNRNSLHLVTLTTDHIYELDNLVDHHRDPFDRIIVAQARFEQMTLITADPHVQAYDVITLW